jgi:hypothetical protein
MTHLMRIRKSLVNNNFAIKDASSPSFIITKRLIIIKWKEEVEPRLNQAAPASKMPPPRHNTALSRGQLTNRAMEMELVNNNNSKNARDRALVVSREPVQQSTSK